MPQLLNPFRKSEPQYDPSIETAANPLTSDIPQDVKSGDKVSALLVLDQILSDGNALTLFDDSGLDPVYHQKQRLVARAMDEIGWGRYQWVIFFVTGFGWFGDNVWPIATSLIIPRLVEVDGPHPPAEGKAPYITLAQNLGLLAGALFWSLSLDIIGRKWAFNLTFLITGVFATVAGSLPNFAAVGIFDALWSFGVGGNLPVDLAIFLEAIPSNKQWLLTVMSSWWALGQIIANLVSWGLISNYSCPADLTNCMRADNWGWRYFLFTMGGLTLIMFLFRFCFKLHDLAKFYIGKGDNAKAIDVLNKIAKFNRTTQSLTLEDLDAVDRQHGAEKAPAKDNQLLKEKLLRFLMLHLRECFGLRKLAWLTSLVVFTWGIIGLAFPLFNAFIPFYLALRGTANEPLSVQKTYRNTLIVAVLGIPGLVIGGLLTEFRCGRKGVLIVSLILTGVFQFAGTTAKTSDVYLGWTCLFSFFSAMMYGVLYAYTPEVFHTKIRGTGVGLAASFNRVMGVFAPIIAMYADLTTAAPIYVSGALFILSGLLVILFPYEPRGKLAI